MADAANTISTLVGVVVAVLGAFLFAFWIAMGIWTFNDIRSRTRDWLAILLACLLVLIFPIVGLVLYSMIRPKETLAEIYDRALEEEALLRELEETLACYSCGVPVKDEWVFCPNCHSQLQHACINCSKLVRQDWDICVNCGTMQQARAEQQIDVGVYDYSRGRKREVELNGLRSPQREGAPSVPREGSRDPQTETMPYQPVRPSS